VWQKWTFSTEQVYPAKQAALENCGPLEGRACACEIYAREQQDQTSFPAGGRKLLRSVYPAPPHGPSGLNSRLWRTEACKRSWKFLEKIILVEV